MEKWKNIAQIGLPLNKSRGPQANDLLTAKPFMGKKRPRVRASALHKEGPRYNPQYHSSKGSQL